jgi:hypothetical protein
MKCGNLEEGIQSTFVKQIIGEYHHVDNDLYLLLLKQTESMTTYLSKLDIVSTIPSRFLALGSEPPNVKSNLLTGG